MSDIHSPVETSVEERRLLRVVDKLVRRSGGQVYVDTPSFQAKARKTLVDSVLAKGLVVETDGRFDRTSAGNQALRVRQIEGVPLETAGEKEMEI